MIKPKQAIDGRKALADKLIVALDVPTASEAREIVDEIVDRVGMFKIGLQLFTASGPQFVKELTSRGIRVFLDLKFHDIPNTVAAAAVEAARCGVWMLNVHASGGERMMRDTVDVVRTTCSAEGIERPKLIAVTVLTSLDDEELSSTGVERGVTDQVIGLARLAAVAGMDGVVASAHEVSVIRKAVGRDDFLIVTPGIRPVSATGDDQKRVMTFARAITAGSDYAVVGRPIIAAEDRALAVESMVGGSNQDLED